MVFVVGVCLAEAGDNEKHTNRRSRSDRKKTRRGVGGKHTGGEDKQSYEVSDCEYFNSKCAYLNLPGNLSFESTGCAALFIYLQVFEMCSDV